MVWNHHLGQDYDHRPEVDAHGRYRDRFYYTGQTCDLPFTPSEKQRVFRGVLAYAALLLASVLLPGLVNQPSSRILWVCLPYILIFLPVIYFVFGVFSFGDAGVTLTREGYEKSVLRMRRSALAVLVMAAISALCALSHLILWLAGAGMEPSADVAAVRLMGGDLLRELLYLLLHLPIAVSALAYGRYHARRFASCTPPAE